MTVSTQAQQLLLALQQEVTACTRCARLVTHCQKIAEEKRWAYRDWVYWGKPVPGWGDPLAEMLLLGLAPGAHGANRTGRMFTGDRSGDFLYRALWETGFASAPTSLHREDGLELRNVWITASARCAPPDNRPQPEELGNCFGYFQQEVALLPNLRLVVALGGVATATYLKLLKQRGAVKTLSEFPFGHGRLYQFSDATPILCSYHPSQQNTSTGRLTALMLRQIFEQAIPLLSRKRFPHPNLSVAHLDDIAVGIGDTPRQTVRGDSAN